MSPSPSPPPARRAPRRRQADRTAMTRAALVAAARELFADRGYAEVGTEEVASRAGVTRGALYHQFADKAALFAEVVEAVEIDVSARLVEVVGAHGGDGPLAMLLAGADAWLDASAEAEVRRIVVLDGPAVLGWERWRQVIERHGLGLVAGLLGELMEAGAIPMQPVGALAHVLMGALDEASQFVALADDPAAAREDARVVLHRLITAVVTHEPKRRAK